MKIPPLLFPEEEINDILKKIKNNVEVGDSSLNERVNKEIGRIFSIDYQLSKNFLESNKDFLSRKFRNFFSLRYVEKSYSLGFETTYWSNVNIKSKYHYTNNIWLILNLNHYPKADIKNFLIYLFKVIYGIKSILNKHELNISITSFDIVPKIEISHIDWGILVTDDNKHKRLLLKRIDLPLSRMNNLSCKGDLYQSNINVQENKLYFDNTHRFIGMFLHIKNFNSDIIENPKYGSNKELLFVPILKNEYNKSVYDLYICESRPRDFPPAEKEFILL